MSIEIPKSWNDIIDVFDKQYPKGRCKERGPGLVVMAYAKMLIDQLESENSALLVDVEKLRVGCSITRDTDGLNVSHASHIDELENIVRTLGLKLTAANAEIEIWKIACKTNEVYDDMKRERDAAQLHIEVLEKELKTMKDKYEESK